MLVVDVLNGWPLQRKFRLGRSVEIIFELVFNQFNPIFGEVRIRPLGGPFGRTKCISGLRGIPGVTLKLAAACRLLWVGCLWSRFGMGTAPSERLDQSGRLAIKYSAEELCVVWVGIQAE